MLDRHHVLAIEHHDQSDAGIGRGVMDAIAVQLADQDRARPAITLGASFLGATQGAIKPQEIEQRAIGVDGVEFDQGVVEIKANGAARLHDQLPR